MGRWKAVALPCALVVLTAFVGCREGREEEKPRLADSDPATTAVGTPKGRFAGSESCRPCHEAEFAAWNAGRHHKALAPVTEAGVSPRLADLPLEDGLRVARDGQVVAPAGGGAEARGQAAYVAGGRHREDLWVRMPDGRLQVFPASYDLDTGRAFQPIATLAGGHPPPADTIDFWTRSGRSADLTCYGCHATGATLAIAGATETGFAIPVSRWSEAGVGCEACHGPSGPHVVAAGKGEAAGTPPPSTGKEDDAEVRVALCASCHAHRETLSTPFRIVPAQGYGAPLWEWADPLLRVGDNAEFREPLFDDLRPATYQQEAIALGQSACVRKGGLDCGHCHDVHGAGLRPGARTDAACLPCHQAVVTRAADHARHPAGAPGGRCIDCHMAPILRGPGREPARDHTLAPPVAGAGEVPAACTSCHAGGPTPGGGREGKPLDGPRLIAGWAAFPPGGKETARRTRIARAVLDAAGGKPDGVTKLAALAGDTTEAWFVRYAAATRLAQVLQGRREPSIARTLRPGLDDANPSLRRAILRTAASWAGPVDRERLGRMAVEADPFAALEALHALGALGSPDHDARLVQLARRPGAAGEYRVQLALGRAALLAEDWPRAEKAFARALELRPFLVPALSDLGIALHRQGKIVPAQQMWLWALEINPRYEAARLNLDSSRR